MSNELPRLLITMGDVAGIGPEIIAKAWPQLLAMCQPIVIGDVGWLRKASRSADIPCIAATTQDLRSVVQGQISAAAGRAAYDFLCTAIDLVLAKKADGIVTLPLHKEGLHAAGLSYPGHTEILAERMGVVKYGMLLYAPPGCHLAQGLGVVHVTLHMALKQVFAHLSSEAVLGKIHLLRSVMAKLCEREPRLAVAALNPHASDGGLFGDEEKRILQPAVERASRSGINVSGPWPSDTLFVRAQRGEFDGIVAMYHDQGHIPLKLLTGLTAVNITVGLPIIRTSVAHGTAYDIAGQDKADPSSLIEAVRVAVRLVRT
jgi:4-hydroxythreonine-4-phosphate dehydrogenase